MYELFLIDTKQFCNDYHKIAKIRNIKKCVALIQKLENVVQLVFERKENTFSLKMEPMINSPPVSVIVRPVSKNEKQVRSV